MSSLSFSTILFTFKNYKGETENMYGYDSNNKKIDPISVRHCEMLIRFFDKNGSVYCAYANGDCHINHFEDGWIELDSEGNIYVPHEPNKFLSAAELTAILNKIKAAKPIQ